MTDEMSARTRLLAIGDGISPSPSGGAQPRHLHALLSETAPAPAAPAAAPAPAASASAAAAVAESSESEDEGMLSDPEETERQEERLERRLGARRARLGLDNARTLRSAFRLLDCLIGQYKLNRTEALLDEVAPVCKRLGGDWHVKAIQSLAFCRWKQYRFGEALALFLEQQQLVGPSAALCENIGHTYSSLGELERA